MSDIPADDITRTPPHDLAAEQATLGGLMLAGTNQAWTEDAFDTIRGPDDFYRPTHQTIYTAIVRLARADEPFDVIAVAADLGRHGETAIPGGPDYLHTLISGTPSVASTGHYAGIVARKAMVRRMREAGIRIVQLTESAAPEDDIMDRCGQEFTRAAVGVDTDEGVMAEDVIADAYTKWTNPTIGFVGLRTGFGDLDDILGGLRGGQLVLVAARPGIGKSTLGLDVARNVARVGDGVYFASLEMPAEELANRLMSAEAAVSLTHIRESKLTAAELERITRKLGDVTALPIMFDTRPNLTVHQIRSAARTMKRKKGMGLIVVDYLQIVASPPKKYENRQVEVTEIVRSLKQLARELDVPIVAMVQLNRQVEGRADGRPKLSDIRESGAIEQEADIVVMIYREEEVEKESARPGEVDLIVEKNRNGPKGVVTVAQQLHYARFVSMASEDLEARTRGGGTVARFRQPDYGTGSDR